VLAGALFIYLFICCYCVGFEGNAVEVLKSNAIEFVGAVDFALTHAVGSDRLFEN
jgi:hypothetical protein